MWAVNGGREGLGLNDDVYCVCVFVSLGSRYASSSSTSSHHASSPGFEKRLPFHLSPPNPPWDWAVWVMIMTWDQNCDKNVKDVKRCQRISKNVRGCQRTKSANKSKNIKGCQRMSKDVKGCQRMSKMRIRNNKTMSYESNATHLIMRHTETLTFFGEY